MFKGLGLQAKIITIAVIISIVSILALSLISLMSYQTQYHQAADTIAEELRFGVEQRMNARLDIGLTNALSVAANEALLQAVQAGDKGLTHQILDQVNQT